MENGSFLLVKEYISKKFGLNKGLLVPSNSLWHDLNIYGEDLDFFLKEFAEEFKIPLENIDLTAFDIGVEPFDIVGFISIIWKGKKNRIIILSDLATALENSKLT